MSNRGRLNATVAYAHAAANILRMFPAKRFSGIRNRESGFRIQGSGFRIQDSGIGKLESGFRDQDSGFRIQAATNHPASSIEHRASSIHRPITSSQQRGSSFLTPDTRFLARRAYTLIEILVVVGIFTILGSMLIGLLYGAIRTWRQGESARQTFQQAAVAIEQLREDLTAVYTIETTDKTYSPAEPVEIRLLCRYVEDPDNAGTYKQEFAFVRTIPQIVKNMVSANAGNLADDDNEPSDIQSNTVDDDGDKFMLQNDGIDNDSDGNADEDDEGDLGVDETGEGIDEEWYNLVDDDNDGQVDEDLRPLGDLMQVLYTVRGNTLYRGVQAPLAASRDPLDSDRNLTDDPERFSITATPISPLISGVVFFGVRFWTPHTTSWEEDLGKGDPDIEPQDPGGPEEIWDSTRGLTLTERTISILKAGDTGNVNLPALDARPSSAEKREVGSSTLEFYYYKAPTDVVSDYNYRPPVLESDGYDTYFDPSDDVFPRRVRVTLVITNTRGRPRVAALKEDLNDSEEGMIVVDDSTIFRSDDHKYVKIDQEWIQYTHFGAGGSIIIAPGGRGARGTVPAAHTAGTDVETGRTFVLTIDLPSYRELKE